MVVGPPAGMPAAAGAQNVAPPQPNQPRPTASMQPPASRKRRSTEAAQPVPPRKVRPEKPNCRASRLALAACAHSLARSSVPWGNKHHVSQRKERGTGVYPAVSLQGNGRRGAAVQSGTPSASIQDGGGVPSANGNGTPGGVEGGNSSRQVPAACRSTSVHMPSAVLLVAAWQIGPGTAPGRAHECMEVPWAQTRTPPGGGGKKSAAQQQNNNIYNYFGPRSGSAGSPGHHAGAPAAPFVRCTTGSCLQSNRGSIVGLINFTRIDTSYDGCANIFALIRIPRATDVESAPD